MADMTVLQKRIEEAEARLKKLKEQDRARKQKERQRLLAQSRKDDTRRKILIGAMYFERMKKDDEFKEQMLKALDKYLTTERDRKLFQLENTTDVNQGRVNDPIKAVEQ